MQSLTNELAAIAKAWPNLPPHVKEVILILAQVTPPRSSLKAQSKKVYPHSWPTDGIATPNDAASFLKVSRSTVYELMKSKKLAYQQIGRRRRISWAALRAFESRK